MTRMRSNDQNSNQSPTGANQPWYKADLPQPVDLEEARERVHSMAVRASVEIVQGLIQAAVRGQAAPAKYLFEIAGVYPVPEDTGSEGEEKFLAETLLKRLGLPLTPPDDDAMSVHASASGEFGYDPAWPAELPSEPKRNEELDTSGALREVAAAPDTVK